MQGDLPCYLFLPTSSPRPPTLLQTIWLTLGRSVDSPVFAGPTGVDINPKAQGPGRRIFREDIRMAPINPQTNGPQLFYGRVTTSTSTRLRGHHFFAPTLRVATYDAQ